MALHPPVAPSQVSADLIDAVENAFSGDPPGRPIRIGMLTHHQAGVFIRRMHQLPRVRVSNELDLYLDKPDDAIYLERHPALTVTGLELTDDLLALYDRIIDARRAELVERLREIIGWVSERDHGVAVDLDLVVHQLEQLARSARGAPCPVVRGTPCPDDDRPVVES